MTRKLSGWFRIFIVFAVVWTVVSITLFCSYVPSKKHIEGLRAIDIVTSKMQNRSMSEIEERYKLNLKERRKLIYRYPLLWLVPIVFVCGTGWCVGWIIRGFRKEG